ncbi:hypothetical protein ACLOJK_026827 [Asimina triloba]
MEPLLEWQVGHHADHVRTLALAGTDGPQVCHGSDGFQISCWIEVGYDCRISKVAAVGDLPWRSGAGYEGEARVDEDVAAHNVAGQI